MNKIINISICIFMLFGWSDLISQNVESGVVDRIYLKDGSILMGNVTFGEANYSVTLLDGQFIEIPKTSVKKIVQSRVGEQKRELLFNLDNKRKSGLAHQFGFSIINNGTDPEGFNYFSNDNSSGGVQIDYTLQKFINRYFSAGIKLGLQKAYFISENDLNVNVPMAISWTNYFFTKFPSVFIDNTFGYNYVHGGTLEYYGVNKGGFYYTPTVGLRIPTRSNYNFLLGVGINFQHLENIQRNEWSSNHKKYNMKRYTFSLAFQF